MRRLRTTILAIVPALVVAVAGVLNSAPAQAAFAGYAASDVLGQLTAGNPDFTTSNDAQTLPTADNMTYPEGTVIDTVHHRLFVVVSESNRVLIYNLDNDNNLIDHTADYVLGQPDFNTTTGSTDQHSLNWPLSAAYDANRNLLFVGECNNPRLVVYDLSNGIVNGMNASYVLGQQDFTSNTDQSGQNGLSCTYGIGYDSITHYLYVGDANNRRLMVFDTTSLSTGMNASYVLGQPDFTTTTNNDNNPQQDNMGFPYGIAVDPARHRLFVADDNRAGRVLVYDTSNLSNGMNASYELGQPDFTSGASGPIDPPTAASMDPEGLAYDPLNQHLFVEDDHAYRVLMFDTSTLTNGQNAVAVLGAPDFTTNVRSNGCAPSQTTVCDPEGLNDYYDVAHNRLYVSDSGNNRVMIFNLAKLASELNDPAVGDSYSQWMGSQFQGTPTFSVTAGSLPPGLTLDASSGLLSGVFTQAGTFNFTIQLVDDLGSAGSFTDTHSYSLVVDPAVAAAGAATLSNTGLNIGIGSGAAITLLAGSILVYRKRNHLYRLWGWER